MPMLMAYKTFRLKAQLEITLLLIVTLTTTLPTMVLRICSAPASRFEVIHLFAHALFVFVQYMENV